METAGKAALVSTGTNLGARGPSKAKKQQDLTWPALSLFTFIVMLLVVKVQLALPRGAFWCERGVSIGITPWCSLKPFLFLLLDRESRQAGCGVEVPPYSQERTDRQERNVRRNGDEAGRAC